MLFLPAPAAAVVQQARPAEKAAAVRALQEALEGIPEALTDHHPERVAAAKRHALQVWDRQRVRLAGAFAPSGDEALAALFKQMETADGAAAADLALDASARLATLEPVNRSTRLALADRDCMRAWLRVTAGEWDTLPALAADFAPFLAEPRPQHARAREKTARQLRELDLAVTGKDQAAAARALEALLERVDDFEK